jgi:hypothetical protein
VFVSFVYVVLDKARSAEFGKIGNFDTRRSSMKLSPSQRLPVVRRNTLRPSIEALETRQVLSNLTTSPLALAAPARDTSTPMTITMPTRLNGTIDSVATHRMVVVRGHAYPGARVHLEVGNTSRVTQAGALGNYQFRVPMPPGSYSLTVQAKDRAGHS